MTANAGWRSVAKDIPGARRAVNAARTLRRQVRTAYLKTRYPDGTLLQCGPLRIFCDFTDPTYAWYDGLTPNLELDMEVVERLVEQSQGMLLLDVGAHCGFFTALLARCAASRPGSRVIAIEPDSRHFRCLERTVAAQGSTVVTLVRGAVSDHDGRIDLYQTGTPCLHTYPEDGAEQVDSVRAYTVDSIAQEFAPGEKVGFLKVDVDGAEPSVVAGARRTLLEDDAILLMEFAPTQLRASGTDPLAFLSDQLQQFEVYAVSYRDFTISRITLPGAAAMVAEIGDNISDLIVSRRPLDLSRLRQRRTR